MSIPPWLEPLDTIIVVELFIGAPTRFVLTVLMSIIGKLRSKDFSLSTIAITWIVSTGSLIAYVMSNADGLIGWLLD